MSKRTVFTTLTPLPTGISRDTVMETLPCHEEMINLNPLVEERHPVKPPPHATPEEFRCLWSSLTDRVQYLPGGIASGKVSYSACFHGLENGLQTHCYAPMGLNIKGEWTLGGSLPGEPIEPVELGWGAPLRGLYLREDVDFRCNIMMTAFVKKTIKKAHARLVDRLVVKAQIEDAAAKNQKLEYSKLLGGPLNGSYPSTEYDPSEYGSTISSEDSQFLTFQQPENRVSMFRLKESTGYDNNTNDSHMYPKGLNIHSSTSSVNGSVSEIQGQSSFCSDPAQGSENIPSNRFSWQMPGPNQTLSMGQIEPLPIYQSKNPYQAPVQGYYFAELYSSESYSLPRQTLGVVSGNRQHPNQLTSNFCH